MKKLTLVIFALTLAGCATGPMKTEPTGACPPCPAVPPLVVSAKVPVLAPLFLAAPENLPIFEDGDVLKPLLKAALLNRAYFQGLKSGVPPYTFGARKITPKELAESNEEFIKILASSPTAQDFDRLVKEKFDIYQIMGGFHRGFSSIMSPRWRPALPGPGVQVPIYAKPEDLLTINLEDFNESSEVKSLPAA